MSITVALLLSVPLQVFAQSSEKKSTKNTQPNTKTKEATKKIQLSDVAWIAGDWQGEAMGGEFEESWNPPMGGSMMGMFKFVKDNEVGFYELLTIVEEDGTLMLRLKHFDKKLNGWEAKEKSVEFPFVSHSEKETVFDGLKFVRIDETRMRIVVKVKQGEGKIEELKFECKRAGKSIQD